MHLIHILVTTFLFVNVGISTPIILKSKAIHYVVEPKNIQYFSDSTNSLSFEDILTKNVQFKIAPSTSIDNDNLNNYLWLKIDIQNESKDSNSIWIFESWGFDIEELEIYSVKNSISPTTIITGSTKPFITRLVPHKNFQLPFSFYKNDTISVYLKVKRSYAMRFSFHIRSYEAFQNHFATEYNLLGIFYGIMLLLMLMNIYLFVSLKENMYGIFALVVFFEILFCLGRDGLGFQFLWPNLPWLNKIVQTRITELGVIVSIIFYSLHFLNATSYKTNLFKLYSLAGIIKLLSFLIDLFLYPLSNVQVFFIDIVVLSVPFIVSIVTTKINYRNYFIVAYFSLLICFFQIYLSDVHLIKNQILNWYLVNGVFLISNIFFSLSIINKMKTLTIQKNKAQENLIHQLKENDTLKDSINKNLEEKVTQRTQELNIKNEELETLHDKVSAMNAILEKNNLLLQTDLTKTKLARIFQKEVKFDEFKQVFPDESSCYKYLSELKWKGKFQCKKCGYTKDTNSKNEFGKRCKSCNYDESPTTGTLFHNLRFPITKAFYLIYLTNQKEKALTTDQLSEILSLRRETCWSFKQKVIRAKEKLNETKKLKEETDGWEALALISLIE